MSKQNQSLESFWMPFTGNRDFKKDPRIIVSGEGNYYTSADGRKIFDGLSGLWTCGAGHGRPEITEAVSKQIKQLDFQKTNMKDINERKLVILETIIGLKDKVSKDVSKLRVEKQLAKNQLKVKAQHESVQNLVLA